MRYDFSQRIKARESSRKFYQEIEEQVLFRPAQSICLGNITAESLVRLVPVVGRAIGRSPSGLAGEVWIACQRIDSCRFCLIKTVP